LVISSETEATCCSLWHMHHTRQTDSQTAISDWSSLVMLCWVILLLPNLFECACQNLTVTCFVFCTQLSGCHNANTASSAAIKFLFFIKTSYVTCESFILLFTHYLQLSATNLWLNICKSSWSAGVVTWVQAIPGIFKLHVCWYTCISVYVIL
jgi:hypothetical protein